LVIGGVQKNAGPGMEAEKIVQVVSSVCDGKIKSGTPCSTCWLWFHNSCGNVKTQVAESGKWICGKWRSERLRLLEEKLQNVLLQIDDLTMKNKALEEQLRLATVGREVGSRDTMLSDRKGGEGLVLGASIIRNVGNECSDMKIECSITWAVINSSMSAWCGASSGCDADDVQVRMIAVNILKNEWRTSDKGSPPVWWLSEQLSQHRNSLMRYGIFHKDQDGKWWFGTIRV